jgi:hypothetical protein
MCRISKEQIEEVDLGILLNNFSISGSSLIINNSLVDGSVATNDGGIVFANLGSVLEINNSTF